MTHDDRMALIRPGVDSDGGTWADLGAGSGAFTEILAEVLGGSARIYAVDRDGRSLRGLERENGPHAASVQTIEADFTGEMSLPPLDGILLANSLHFLPDACAVLSRARRWLKPGGRLIIVEYDIQRPNPWVPYPVSRADFRQVVECAGFTGARLLGERPSRYHGRAYSGLARRADAEE